MKREREWERVNGRGRKRKNGEKHWGREIERRAKWADFISNGLLLDPLRKAPRLQIYRVSILYILSHSYTQTHFQYFKEYAKVESRRWSTIFFTLYFLQHPYGSSLCVGFWILNGSFSHLQTFEILGIWKTWEENWIYFMYPEILIKISWASKSFSLDQKAALGWLF